MPVETRTVRWIEWIRIRMPPDHAKTIETVITELCTKANQIPGLITFAALSSISTPCDMGIMLGWSLGPPGPDGTPLAATLFPLLRRYGLLDYSSWMVLDQDMQPQREPSMQFTKKDASEREPDDV